MRGFLALILCQAVGDLLARSLAVPISGSIVGIVLLFLFFVWRGEIPAEIARAGDALLSWMPLLIVPAGVGVTLYLDAIAGEAVAIVCALLLSTAIAIAATGSIAQWLLRRRSGVARQWRHRNRRPWELGGTQRSTRRSH